MEMANTQTLFCRMDYQNCSVWKTEQDEAGHSWGNEQKRSVWKTDGLQTELSLQRAEDSTKNWVCGSNQSGRNLVSAICCSFSRLPPLAAAIAIPWKLLQRSMHDQKGRDRSVGYCPTWPDETLAERNLARSIARNQILLNRIDLHRWQRWYPGASPALAHSSFADANLRSASTDGTK